MLDKTKVTRLTFAGIDFRDYPKFCDAYIDSACYMDEKGERELTEEEMEWLRDNEPNWFYQELESYIHRD